MLIVPKLHQRCNEQVWEAEIIDPISKFVISHVQGKRDKELIRRLLEDGAQRLYDKHGIALFTDGDASYASVFPEIFGIPYQRERYGRSGRLPKVKYRIPRSLAHIQIIKTRSGKRLQSVKIRYRHGTKKRAMDELLHLNYQKANTSIIERRNATARLMNSVQNRKTLAFSRHSTAKLALGWILIYSINDARFATIEPRKANEVQTAHRRNSSLINRPALSAEDR